MSLQSHSDGNDSPPMGEVNQPSKEDILHKLRGMQEDKYLSRLWLDSGFYGRKFMVPENLVDLDSQSYLAIRTANGACNRTAPVFLVQDLQWWHWLTSAIFFQELLLYTLKRWFRPYESHIDRGQFLTRVCVVPRSPAPPIEACSQEMVDYIKMWSTNLCDRVAFAQSEDLDYAEEAAGERLFHMRPLFRAVAVAIRTSSFNVKVTDISTIPVLIIRTGVEDGLSAPIDLEQVPECDRQAVTTDSQGRLSAVQVTLDVAITFLMALEKREEADGPVTRDVMQSTRVMKPSTDDAAAYMDKFGWKQDQMGPLMGPSNLWVDATKRPRLSVEEHESFKVYRNMCDQQHQEAETMMDEIEYGVFCSRETKDPL
ncbi:hypothetical protein BBO_05443 [Beauveria brongniartii RCEF 3172]|uniref:Uncharacterized protein n=1 Tax=Beauveria brongniartii RCEF 3172 TaxID=1081107 RepID=A0A167CQE7_9HYPO|nr:hypothetical protein BBO_05443 [Beauveria brongniartii RCEF 3172]